MSSSLYEELGISRDATPEQIRKAYKKKALLTHPDRLPPGATPEEKASSEENFRKVNNAYEILIDPNKRKEYNVHGVWPPPEELPSPHWSTTAQHGSHYGRRPTRSHTFPDPFFSHGPTFHPFHFTDPFALFEEIFAGTPFSRSSRHQHPFFNRSFQPTRFDHMQTEIEAIMDELDRDAFGMRSFPSFGPPIPTFPMITSSTFGNNGRGRWVSDSYSSTTVNGVTQSIHRRVDTDGNEHITRTLPDGRQVRTINGVEQPTHPHAQITYPASNRDIRLQEPPPNRYLPAPPPPIPQNMRLDYGVPASQSYPGPSQSQGYYDGARAEHDRHCHHLLHKSRDKSRHPSESDADHRPPQAKHHKRWWPTRQ